MRPSVTVSIDGRAANPVFYERLLELVVVDREGIRADELQLRFADGPPHMSPPRRKAIVSVTLASGSGDAFVGDFVIDHVEMKCLPYELAVKGHSADFQSGMKTNKSRHWDNATVQSIVAQIAREYDLEPKISSSVSDHVYEWIGQLDETDLAFLERLAQRHSALFTIKAGALLWLRRGVGVSADDQVIASETIRARDIVVGTCKVVETDVRRYNKIKAFWQDNEAAKRKEVVVTADEDASGEHVLRDPFASEEEAQRACQSAAREMTRGVVATTCTTSGRPRLMSGQPVQYFGVRPDVDHRQFILNAVTHRFSKASGFTTQFRGKLAV